MTESPFGLPKGLRELLKRDVALALSHRQIASRLAEVQAEAQTLQKSRPPFMFLQPKSTRTTFSSQLINASESLVALTNGLKTIERLQPMLHAWVEDELETHLRTKHVGYVLGLATHRYPEDWERFSRRFGMRAQRFSEFTHTLRNAIGQLGSSRLISEDTATADLVARTAKVGAAVDAEIIFLNRLADLQRVSLAPDPGTLQRQPLMMCEASISRLAELTATQAISALNDFIAVFQVQVQKARGAVVAEGSLAVVGGGPKAAAGFVLSQWESLRKLVRLELDPEAIQQLVADTEKLLGGHV